MCAIVFKKEEEELNEKVGWREKESKEDQEDQKKDKNEIMKRKMKKADEEFYRKEGNKWEEKKVENLEGKEIWIWKHGNMDKQATENLFAYNKDAFCCDWISFLCTYVTWRIGLMQLFHTLYLRVETFIWLQIQGIII